MTLSVSKQVQAQSRLLARTLKFATSFMTLAARAELTVPRRKRKSKKRVEKKAPKPAPSKKSKKKGSRTHLSAAREED